MNKLDALQTSEEIKEEEDRIGSSFGPIDTDVYTFTIKTAYITESKSKAMALNLDLETADNKKLKQRFYMTSGEAKGCKNYYTDKNGVKQYLPGFNHANAVCLLTVGKEISNLAKDVKTKTIPLYNPEEQKEVPTDVDMIMPLLGKKIMAAVHRQIEDKKKLNDNTGKYEPTGETIETNEIDKIFRASDRLTVQEIKARKSEPEFIDKWINRFKGQVKDKTDKKKGVTKGSPIRTSGKQATKENLFA